MKSVLGRSHGVPFMYTEVTNRNETVYIKNSMKYKHVFFWPTLQRVRKTEKNMYIAFSLFLCRTQYCFKLAILGTVDPHLTGILSAGWRQVAEVKTMAVHHHK